MATDQELQTLHDAAEGTARELYGELIQARKAIVIARQIAQLGPVLASSTYVMTLQGCPKDELQLAIVHKKPDGSGQVGPCWDLGEFADDLEKLSKLVNTEDEQMGLGASGLAAIFGGVKRPE